MWWRKMMRASVDHHKAMHDRTKANQLMETLIGANTGLKGDLTFRGGIHIDGVVIGSVAAIGEDESLLVLGEGSEIHGDVRVNRAVINGRVEGDLYIYAHLELGPKALILGDVHYQRMEMAVGAAIQGGLKPNIQNLQNEPSAFLQDLRPCNQNGPAVQNLQCEAEASPEVEPA
jgi:cytoskeletal protein CcmA (bactofilin family)